MPNVGGPSVSKRRLLVSVIVNELLYAAQIWSSNNLQYQTNKRALDKALRLAALRVIRAYRTVSTEASHFLAKISPGDLLAKERTKQRRRSQLLEQQLFETETVERARQALVDE